MDVVQTKRDYTAELRKLIDERRSPHGYNAGLVAHDVVQYLLIHDRELLFGMFEDKAVDLVRGIIVASDAATRSYARTNSRRGVFSEAAQEAKASGNTEPLRQGFLQAVYVVDAENTRKSLKDMTAEDVLFVAAGYEDRARSAKLEAAFFRALAARIGNGVVADNFNNIQLAEFRNSITGSD